MKKVCTLFMALALATSLFAVPVSPKLQKKGEKAQTEQKMEQRARVMPQINLTKVQDLVRPVVRKAPTTKKNVNHEFARKSPMATAPVTFSGSDFTGGTSGEGSAMTISKGGVTITTDKGYGSGSQLRVYSGGTLTITATEKMTNISFDNDGNAKLVLDDQTPNATTWSVSATAQIRLNEIVVSFEGSTPDPLDTLTVAEALAEAKKLAGGATSTKKYVIEGYVSTVAYEYSQGKQTFYLTDTKGDRTGELQAFKCSLDEEVKQDYKMSITGKLMNYVKSGTSTYEITGGVGKILEKPEGSDTEISGLTQAYAIYYQDGEGYYWDFDLAVEFDEESVTYPELYFMCDDEASSKTSIVGTYAAYYAMVWNSAKDSVETDEEEPVGTMTVTYVEEGVYNFEGSFEGTDGNTYTWSATNVEVIAVDGDNEYEIIELDEEGGGSTVDTVVVPVNYVMATRMDEYSEPGAYLWEIDAMNFTSETNFENLWFNIYTPQNNRLEGIYDIEKGNIYNYWGYYYAGYSKVNGADTTDVWAGSENIQLTVVYDENSKKYDLVGELLSEDSKTLYQFEIEDMDIEAFDEEMKDIVLVDSTEFVPDTIDITGMNAIEIAYYASYSEEGAYNYSVNLYNSNDEDGVPYLALDIYTATENAFVGSYDTLTNVGEYCSYYPNAESYGSSVINPVFTISQNGDVYTVAGQFIGADQNIYRFNVSAEATMADGDYPYEPMEKQEDINIVANSKTLDTQYVSDYSELDLYLNSASDTIQLALVTSKTTLSDGTYEISTEDEPNEGELYAGYYTYYGLGGCVAYVGDDVYYLVEGALNVATANDTTTYSLYAFSAHGTVINATYKEAKAGPTPGEHTIIIENYQDTAFSTTDGIYSVVARKAKGTQAPAYNSNGKDLRIYASGTLEISATSEMTEIIFNISAAGLKRQAAITPSTGDMAYDMTNSKVTWTGKANKVTFTVGAKAEYGSEGATKAGQFDFTSMDITLVTSALEAVSKNGLKSGKCMINGQLFIIKNGVLYNAQGQIIK